MSKVFIEESSLSAIGDAIRGKTGKTDLLSTAQMVEEINGIETGGGDKLEYSSAGLYMIFPSAPQNVEIKGKTVSRIFYNWNRLLEVPDYDTSNVTDFEGALYMCYDIKKIPNWDFSNAKTLANFVRNDKNLEEIYFNNTSNVTNFSFMALACDKLKTLGEMDCSSATDIRNMVVSSPKLANIGGFKSLGKAYLTTKSAEYNYYTLTLSSSCATHESLINVINNLYDIGSLGVQPQSLVLGSTNLAKLTQEEIDIASNKGWLVT